MIELRRPDTFYDRLHYMMETRVKILWSSFSIWVWMLMVVLSFLVIFGVTARALFTISFMPFLRVAQALCLLFVVVLFSFYIAQSDNVDSRFSLTVMALVGGSMTMYGYFQLGLQDFGSGIVFLFFVDMLGGYVMGSVNEIGMRLQSCWVRALTDDLRRYTPQPPEELGLRIQIEDVEVSMEHFVSREDSSMLARVPVTVVCMVETVFLLIYSHVDNRELMLMYAAAIVFSGLIIKTVSMASVPCIRLEPPLRDE